MFSFQRWFRTASVVKPLSKEPQPDACWWELMRSGNEALTRGCPSQAIEYYTRARVHCQLQLENGAEPRQCWLDGYQRSVENCVDCWRYVGLCDRARANEEAARQYFETIAKKNGHRAVAIHYSRCV